MRIELRQVSVRYGERTVLEGIDLDLAPGSLAAVVGPTGAGLTTLLKVAAGLVRPTVGAVLHDGQDLADLDEVARRRHQTRTGFMFQDAALWANQTLGANLELPLLARNPAMSAGDRLQRIASALADCGWTAPLDLRPVHLARGEQLMLSFLRAVIPGPDALFLDEPLAGLDGRWRGVLSRRLQQERERGATVLLSSQDPGAVADLAPEIITLAVREGIA